MAKNVKDIDRILRKEIQKLKKIRHKVTYVYPALVGQSIANDKEVEKLLRRFFAKSLIKELFMYDFDKTLNDILKSNEKISELKNSLINNIIELAKSKSSIDMKNLQQLMPILMSVPQIGALTQIITIPDVEKENFNALIKKFISSIEKILETDPYYNEYEIESGIYVYDDLVIPVLVGTKKFQVDDDALAIILLVILILDKPILDVQSLEEVEDVIKRGFILELLSIMNKGITPDFDILKELRDKYVKDKEYKFVSSEETKSMLKYAELLDRKISSTLKQFKLVLSEFIHSSLDILPNDAAQKEVSEEEKQKYIRKKLIEYILNSIFEKYAEEWKALNLTYGINISKIVKSLKDSLNRNVIQNVEKYVELNIDTSDNDNYDIIRNYLLNIRGLNEVLINAAQVLENFKDEYIPEIIQQLVKEIKSEVSDAKHLQSFLKSDYEIVDPLMKINLNELLANVKRLYSLMSYLFKKSENFKLSNKKILFPKILKDITTILYQNNDNKNLKLAMSIKKVIISIFESYKEKNILIPEDCIKDFIVKLNKISSKKQDIPFKYDNRFFDIVYKNFVFYYGGVIKDIQRGISKMVDDVFTQYENRVISEIVQSGRSNIGFEEYRKLTAKIKEIFNGEKYVVKNVLVVLFTFIIFMMYMTVLMYYILYTKIAYLNPYGAAIMDEVKKAFEDVKKDLKLNYVIIVDERVIRFVAQFYSKIILDKYLDCKDLSDEELEQEPECKKIIDLLGRDLVELAPEDKPDISQTNMKYVLAYLNNLLKFSSIITYNFDDQSVLYKMPYMNKPLKTKLDNVKKFVETPLFDVFKS